ncbi:ADP-ribosylglycohydrolase family protein [bacterium]|nr:ADP-ribosylglycohydrolase family protein [bacterium]
MTLPRKDQFQGCLIGLCLGDAVGYPAEGYPTVICQRYTQDILLTGRTGEWTHFPYPFGQYSDDGQLSRELMISYLHCQKFDPADFAHRIATLYQFKKLIGFGKSTEAAIRRLVRGFSWTQTGTLAPAAGNGSTVRAAPLGLLFFDDPDQMQIAAENQSRITHQDNRCIAGAIALGGAVGLAMQTPEIIMEPFLKQLSLWVRPYDPILAESILTLPDWLILPLSEALLIISQTGVLPEYEQTWQGISPFVTSSVLWSLYAFLKSPDDYWQTLCTAISVGGDVDTTAAMAGAISGAHLGLPAIPQASANTLTDQGSWEYTKLLGLAEKCFDVKMTQTLQTKKA